MMNKTKWTTMLGVGAVVVTGGLAQAQAPAPGDGSAITNEQTTVTTETTVTQPQDESILVIEDEAAPPSTLADTGGAPLLMSLSGLLMAGGAFLVRRKIS